MKLKLRTKRYRFNVLKTAIFVFHRCLHCKYFAVKIDTLNIKLIVKTNCNSVLLCTSASHCSPVCLLAMLTATLWLIKFWQIPLFPIFADTFCFSMMLVAVDLYFTIYYYWMLFIYVFIYWFYIIQISVSCWCIFTSFDLVMISRISAVSSLPSMKPFPSCKSMSPLCTVNRTVLCSNDPRAGCPIPQK